MTVEITYGHRASGDVYIGHVDALHLVWAMAWVSRYGGVVHQNEVGSHL
ncbi:hypothetical protein KCP76_08590 [Salmonella enterica subsp. enterica serovar Weltevreden]|nr:hypothetical protein KCP76_08590 [Salmonella enterica subsp. enterica serovar Weltevreden]